jgi:D-alanyl-D-alanine carboxypeptidase/D-alanyl-D-alanine-endopeptidase (penicillin-binding protein 4)
MKKTNLLVACCLLIINCLNSQSVKEKLQKVYAQFEADSQLSHAISSMYVIDGKTGEVIFDKNSQIGLAPASTQKIITATTAFELLGKDYKYKTQFGYDGQIKDGLLIGNIYIIGSGDPTLGSWRFENTKKETIDRDFVQSLHQQKINLQRGSLIGKTGGFETQKIPGGWIWEDIGNYYGAGCGQLNWNENQFDLVLQTGRNVNDSVKIKRTVPPLAAEFLNELKTGKKGSGDNGYIYFSPLYGRYEVRGTEPCCTDSIVISGSASDNDFYTLSHFATVLQENKFNKDQRAFPLATVKDDINPKIFLIHSSPSLDSIVYWFLQKSINIYGEALVKTFAYEKKGIGATDTGVAIVQNFWKEKGLDPDELNIKDGSGLSPQNRVTTHAEVEVLKYAKQQSWFPYFFNALPEYNNMKMKSGTISDVKGFCGYHTSGDGVQYIFSFLVNNYSGPSSAVVQKMYKVLDVLK